MCTKLTIVVNNAINLFILLNIIHNNNNKNNNTTFIYLYNNGIQKIIKLL